MLSALVTAAVMLVAELLTGEAEYRCTAKARESLRRDIFAKALELDVGNIEKIGPVSAITASVDAVESMQVYYSKYLPGLIYCLIAPFYLYGRISQFSPPAAALLERKTRPDSCKRQRNKRSSKIKTKSGSLLTIAFLISYYSI